MDDSEVAKLSDAEYSSLVRSQGWVYGTFYKYREFGEESSLQRDRLEDLIVNRNMWFSRPSGLNDPFECYPILTFGDPALARKRIERAVLRRLEGRNAPPGFYESEVDRLMCVGDYPGEEQARFFSEIDSRIGVFSMSKRWDVSTQWAYYASNGLGLCLAYEVRQRSGFDQVFAVRYTDERPSVDWPKMLETQGGGSDELFDSIKTKAKDWRHEREVRALSTTPGLVQHPEGMLTHIIVGQNAIAADIDWLKSTLETMQNRPLVIEQMTALPDRYGYQKHEIHSWE